MVWAGTPHGQRIEFGTGLPTGAVSLQLLGNDGTELVAEDITPDAGALSLFYKIPAALNTVATDLFEVRTLLWDYETADGLVTGRMQYKVVKTLPFAASPEGVRLKLGIEAHELRDEEVDLLTAYATFNEFGDNTPYRTTGDQGTLLCIHAIEALAALELLATLPVKLAASETSGTNEFKRYGKIDWQWVEVTLLAHIARGRQLIDATFDGDGDDAFSFGTAPRDTDAVTG